MHCFRNGIIHHYTNSLPAVTSLPSFSIARGPIGLLRLLPRDTASQKEHCSEAHWNQEEAVLLFAIVMMVLSGQGQE